ncbi:hypothetical protein D3C83_96460 [compost metagenome]
MVGMLGATGERALSVTASILMRPLFISGSRLGSPVITSGIWLATTSIIATLPPL